MYSKRDAIAYAYSGQDGGGGMPYFIGRQYGSGWLRNLARIAFPILKKVAGFAGNVAFNTAEDMIENRKSFTQSLKDNALNEANRLLTGQGRRRKRGRRTKTITINTPKRLKPNSIFESL